MRHLFGILFLLVCSCMSFAQLSGPLSGNLGPGAFHVIDTISVSAATTLTLLPGTILIFDRAYPFRIYGTLLAEGTETDSIIFTTDTLANPGRWRGLRFLGATSSGSQLAFCLIENSYATGSIPEEARGGGVLCDSSAPAFRNCTITRNRASFGTFYGFGGGVHCQNTAAPTFTNCLISGNRARYGGGIYCNHSSPNCTNCIISNNTAETYGGGAYCGYASPSFIHCTFSDNSTSESWIEWGGGILSDYSTLTMKNTILVYSKGSGLYLSYSASSQITFCDFYGNSYDDIVFASGNPTNGPPNIGILNALNTNGDSCDTYKNIFVSPTFMDSTGGDFHLFNPSHCIGIGDTTGIPTTDIEGNPRPNPPGSAPDIGAYENALAAPGPPEGLSGSLSGTLGSGLYYVIDTISVSAGNTLRLLPGTTFKFYNPYPFEISGTLLAEGTENDSIIFTTDTVRNPERWRGLRFLTSSSAGSKLSYCLIENGYATGEAMESKHGGGAYCHETWPAFEHCTFRNNKATWGGAVSCRFYAPSFESCAFQNNTSTSFGGGVYTWYSNASFTNCIFTDNTTVFGGGAYCSGNAPRFSHCTFFGNTASITCGGIYCSYSQTILNSSIIAFSARTGIQFSGSSSSTVKYCDIFGNSGGTLGFLNGDPSQGPPNIGVISTINANGDSCDIYKNIFFNPLHADTTALDFHLNEDSPCIAAGELDGPNEDFDGNIRPQPPYSPPDIGAFENDQGAVPVWLRNDNGLGGGYMLVDEGFIWASKLYPSYTQFQVDSVKFSVYRPAGTGTTPTLTFRIHLYEDDGTVTTYGYEGEEIECEAPLTEKWHSTILSTPSMNENTIYWFTYNVADCVMIGNFLVGIEILQENAPSLFVDTHRGTVCCTNFYYYYETWFEHRSFFIYPETVGYNHIRAFGRNQGEPVPSEIQLSTEILWLGYSNIHWPGGSEILEDSILIVNASGANNTIENITFTNPAYFWSEDEDFFDLPWNFGPLASRWLTIRCSTNVPEPTLTAGELIVTQSQGGGTTDSCHLSLQGFAGHWIENFAQYPDPICGEWDVLPYDCSTQDNPSWELFTDIGWANHSAMHSYSNYGCYAEDMLVSSPFVNPNGTGIQVRWGNYNRYNLDYDYHGFYWTSPGDPDFHLVTEIKPNWTSEWMDYGPYYISSNADSLQLGFLYKGELADIWGIDEIRVDTLPPMSPVIAHDHHSDDGPATFIDTVNRCLRITAEAFDPNGNFSHINLWLADEELNWTSVAMTPVPGCDENHLYESLVCDLDVCHRYSYYFEADDNDPGTPTAVLPAGAPTNHFHMDIMDSTTGQIAYDNGQAAFLRYSFEWQGRFAVRFTPPHYPYYLGEAMVMVGNIFPDYDHEDIALEVYDDNGANNLPGTLLYGPDESGTSWNLGEDACDDTAAASWITIRIRPCLVISSGDFYISVRNISGSERPDMESFAYDGNGATPNRNYCFYPTEGGGFWGLDTLDTYTGDIMIRALESPCAPMDSVTAYYNKTTNHVVIRWTNTGASSYTIFRSPTNPFDGFAVLGTASSSPFNDTLTLTKAFYKVIPSCGQSWVLEEEKSSAATLSSHPPSPLQTPNGNRIGTLLLNQPWPLMDEQSGALPKSISKRGAMHLNQTSRRNIVEKNTRFPSLPRKIERIH